MLSMLCRFSFAETKISHDLIEGALENEISLNDRHWQGDAIAMIIAEG